MTTTPYNVLTNRQRHVLILSANGLTDLDIAEQLGINKNAARQSRMYAERKLHIQSRAELTRFAVKHQLVEV